MPIKRMVIAIASVCFLFLLVSCGKKMLGTGPVIPPQPAVNEVDYWLTKADSSILLHKQSDILSFGTSVNSNTIIDVDTTITYQSIDGFGYSLTGGSAYVINHLPAADKISLLNELFGTGANSISVSYLRISIGASDLDATVFSYDDMPAGQTDPTLSNFSMSPDQNDLLPVLKAIIAINPAIKIIATPWSPPAWMKDNGMTKGGSLLPQYYDVYARYFVKYIQQMKAEGITINAIAPQNEPLHPGNNPSLLMPAEQERDFIKNSLGPALQTASLNTKIIAYDHNCDHPDYPLTILNDATARNFVDGSAFHLYAGNISALSQVHDAYPDKNLYFTEQWTGSTGSFDGDMKWHTKNVVIGSMRNWSRIALEWNLASDPSFGPHTPGGCTQCKGALTIGNIITRNVSYYIIAHASKFVPAGSVRVSSNLAAGLPNVAFITPAGKKVLIVENEMAADQTFNLRFKNKWAAVTLPAGSVATFTW